MWRIRDRMRALERLNCNNVQGGCLGSTTRRPYACTGYLEPPRRLDAPSLKAVASLARPTTPGLAGFGPREVCADYNAIGHVLLAVLHQARSVDSGFPLYPS